MSGFEYTSSARNPNATNEAAKIMGDKSPKAKDKAKKQDSAVKNQKKNDASTKANVVNALSKKGK